MRTRPLILAALALLAVPSLAADSPGTLGTQVSLLIGYPDEDASATKGVLVVPGTVIPVSPRPAKRPPGSSHPAHHLRRLDREEKASTRLIGVAQSLKETLRLARVEVSYRQTLELELNVGRELPVPAVSSGVRLQLKLLGFNDRSASFEVQFYEHTTPIADTRVTAVRGQQAIVGSLDGEAAPYLFLVIEPRAPGPSLESPDGPLEGDLTPPRVIEKAVLAYTEAAREKRIQGVVIVRTVIAEDGSVEEVEVLKGLPEGLTESAVAAVKQWRFEPATLDGEPVSVYYNLTINFRLEKEKKQD